ncbi:hypothetical protein NQZ68_007688 [Dissostichus eleginoides]|nr:hypothetical protein NQZ68_007688 [Dissostichus eleginoides]
MLSIYYNKQPLIGRSVSSSPRDACLLGVHQLRINGKRSVLFGAARELLRLINMGGAGWDRLKDGVPHPLISITHSQLHPPHPQPP